MFKDSDLIKKYINKQKDAKDRGIEFDLPFLSFRNIYRAKRCRYTGVELTLNDGDSKRKWTDLSVERIDSSKGYVRGNCVAICYAANQFKSKLEDPGYSFSLDVAYKILKKSRKLMGKKL